MAEELDCPLLDINAVTKNQDSWFNDNDGVHPNQTGHAGMAEEFAAMVRELSEITVTDFAVEGTVFDFPPTGPIIPYLRMRCRMWKH